MGKIDKFEQVVRSFGRNSYIRFTTQSGNTFTGMIHRIHPMGFEVIICDRIRTIFYDCLTYVSCSNSEFKEV